MKTLDTVLTAAVIIYFCIYAVLAFLCKKPLKTLLLHALFGILTLAAVDITGRFTGVHIPVNPYTVGLCLGGGVAGTATSLLLSLVF